MSWIAIWTQPADKSHTCTTGLSHFKTDAHIPGKGGNTVPWHEKSREVPVHGLSPIWGDKRILCSWLGDLGPVPGTYKLMDANPASSGKALSRVQHHSKPPLLLCVLSAVFISTKSLKSVLLSSRKAMFGIEWLIFYDIYRHSCQSERLFNSLVAMPSVNHYKCYNSNLSLEGRAQGCVCGVLGLRNDVPPLNPFLGGGIRV